MKSIAFMIKPPAYEDKRESPRLKPWDESDLTAFLIFDVSNYGISRNASDRLAEI